MRVHTVHLQHSTAQHSTQARAHAMSTPSPCNAAFTTARPVANRKPLILENMPGAMLPAKPCWSDHLVPSTSPHTSTLQHKPSEEYTHDGTHAHHHHQGPLLQDSASWPGCNAPLAWQGNKQVAYLDLHMCMVCQQLCLVHVMLPGACEHGDACWAVCHCCLQCVLQG